VVNIGVATTAFIAPVRQHCFNYRRPRRCPTKNTMLYVSIYSNNNTTRCKTLRGHNTHRHVSARNVILVFAKFQHRSHYDEAGRSLFRTTWPLGQSQGTPRGISGEESAAKVPSLAQENAVALQSVRTVPLNSRRRSEKNTQILSKTRRSCQKHADPVKNTQILSKTRRSCQ
jgi:hypothetical protein